MSADKTCTKCGDRIPAEEAQFPPDEEERCHDCADYCDHPNCARCTGGAERAL